MEIAAINVLYELTFKNAIKEFSDKRKEIELTNQHKKGYVAYNAMSSFLSHYETLFTAYNYKEGAGSYSTHEAKEAVIRSYKSNKYEYKSDSLFYFLKEYLPTIQNAYATRLESLKEQTRDPFSITEEEVIILLAKVEACDHYKIDFKREWDKFLELEYDKSRNDLEEESYELNGIEQFEWLGKQKELAELFIELKNKGYIKEIKPAQISAFFTNANSIQQVLKPATDKHTKADTYSGVYTSNYKPRFDTIKPTTNSPDKK